MRESEWTSTYSPITGSSKPPWNEGGKLIIVDRKMQNRTDTFDKELRILVGVVVLVNFIFLKVKTRARE